MDLHLEQLKTDIEAIDETLASDKLTAIHKEKLDAAHRQLVNMRDQLESPDKSLWTELSDYLESDPAHPAGLDTPDCQKGHFMPGRCWKRLESPTTTNGTTQF